MENARIAVELALAHVKRGALAEAAQELTRALRIDPQNPDTYYHLAHIYSHAGQDQAAVAVFRLALAALPQDYHNSRTFVRYEGASFDAKTTLNFFTALAESTQMLRDYLQPSRIVGTYGPAPSPEQDAAVRRLLDERWAAWQAGSLPSPAGARIFLDRQWTGDAPWPRVLTLMPRHVAANPRFVENTLASHSLVSLQELGVAAQSHDGDHLCFDAANPDAAWSGRKPKAEALSDLERHIARFRPDVIVMAGMFEAADDTLTRADMVRLRADYGFKLIDLVADTYPPLPNYALHWSSVADLTVSLTDRGYLELVPGATLTAPCQPLAQSLIRAAPDWERTIDFLCAGSRRRNRDFWCAHVVAAGIDATVLLTDRQAGLGLSGDDFYRQLGRARLVLNNGYVAPGLDILTFRIFEATASGALVLNQASPLYDDHFVPYVHFVPFANVHELVGFARFLLAHEDYRRRMVDEAQRWLDDHYRGELFWRAVLARVAFQQSR